MSLLIFGFNKMEFNLIAAEIISFSAVVSKVNKMFQSFGFYQREYNLEQLNSTKLFSEECFHLHWRRVLWHAALSLKKNIVNNYHLGTLFLLQYFLYISIKIKFFVKKRNVTVGERTSEYVAEKVDPYIQANK
jgi:hypothetical protein